MLASTMLPFFEGLLGSILLIDLALNYLVLRK